MSFHGRFDADLYSQRNDIRLVLLELSLCGSAPPIARSLALPLLSSSWLAFALPSSFLGDYLLDSVDFTLAY